MDAFAERDIVDTLRRASEQRTTLTVAHRLSSITHCDLIVVLDQGQIVEQGNHNELLRRKSGVYSQMWEAQNGEVNDISYAYPMMHNHDTNTAIVLLGHILTTIYPVVTTSLLIQAEAAARREAQKIALATGRSPCDLDFSDLDDDSNNNDSGGGGGDGNGGHGGLISTSDMAAIAVLTGNA